MGNAHYKTELIHLNNPQTSDDCSPVQKWCWCFNFEIGLTDATDDSLEISTNLHV